MVESINKDQQEEIASIKDNLIDINNQINQIQKENQQLNQNTILIAVSKIKPVSYIQEAYNNGQRDFGENYVNELAEKAPQVIRIQQYQLQLPADIRWHFIGHLQSNKCKVLAKIPNLETVQSVDSIKLLDKLQAAVQEQSKEKVLNIFIEIKTSDENTKGGIAGDQCLELIQYLQEKCKNLKFAGIMTIGKEGDLTVFKQMQQLREKIAEKIQIASKEIKLSMGMSADFEEAIKAGSDYVRVGTKIFGKRIYKK